MTEHGKKQWQMLKFLVALLEKNLIYFILALSLGLRLLWLSRQSYWIDEMVSIFFTSRYKWSDIFLDNHPFLYHFLLKIWVLIFGVSEGPTRTLSVIFSVMTTWVVWRLALKIFKKSGPALFAAFFHAISVFSIIYAQETRMYALFELAATVNLYFFYEAYFEKTKLRNFYLSCAFLALTHYGALLIFAFEGFFLLGDTRKKRIYGAFILGLGLAAVSYFINFNWPALDWQKFKYVQEPLSRVPLEVLFHLTNKSIILAWLYGAFFAFSFWTIRKNPEKKKIFYWLGGLIFFCITDVQILSDITQRALMLPRYFIFLNTAFILLFVFCLTQVQKKHALFGGGIITVIALVWLPQAYFETKAPWRELAEKISGTPSSVVYTTRTLAIATPYFEKHKVEVRKLKITQPDDIYHSLSQFNNVWIVENYWGGSSYIDEFEKSLQGQKLNTERFVFQTEFSEPLTAIQVTK